MEVHMLAALSSLAMSYLATYRSTRPSRNAPVSRAPPRHLLNKQIAKQVLHLLRLRRVLFVHDECREEIQNGFIHCGTHHAFKRSTDGVHDSKEEGAEKGKSRTENLAGNSKW